MCKGEARDLKVFRIASHIENKTMGIKPKDAGGRVWKVAFRRELDGLLGGEVLRDVNFSILVNSAEGEETQT